MASDAAVSRRVCGSDRQAQCSRSRIETVASKIAVAQRSRVRRRKTSSEDDDSECSVISSPQEFSGSERYVPDDLSLETSRPEAPLPNMHEIPAAGTF
jgi:hypothetical protein